MARIPLNAPAHVAHRGVPTVVATQQEGEGACKLCLHAPSPFLRLCTALHAWESANEGAGGKRKGQEVFNALFMCYFSLFLFICPCFIITYLNDEKTRAMKIAEFKLDAGQSMRSVR